jgi:hypothetical protein
VRKTPFVAPFSYIERSICQDRLGTNTGKTLKKEDGVFLAGSFGNPAVYMQSATFGVGLLPLDDVFQIHGVSTQAALAVYPRGPNPGCAVRKNALF